VHKRVPLLRAAMKLERTTGAQKRIGSARRQLVAMAHVRESARQREESGKSSEN